MPDMKDIQRENPSQAINQRTTHDRTSDLNRGSGNVLPYPGGLDENGLFRTPIRFRGPENDGVGNERGIPPQTGAGHREVSARNRRDSDTSQSGLTASQLLTQAIEKEQDPWERYTKAPKFAWWLPLIIALDFAVAVALVVFVYLEVTR